jgi:hypothetical protein
VQLSIVPTLLFDVQLASKSQVQTHLFIDFDSLLTLWLSLASRVPTHANTDVGKIGVANLSPCIPIEHGVDGLGELGTARLVDATSINPAPGQSIPPGLLASKVYLSKTQFTFIEATLEVLERHFLVEPCMREDGIRRDLVAEEFYQFQSLGINIQQTHDGRACAF